MDIQQALLVLGIAEPFTSEDLRKAYKEQAFAWHPDRYEAGSSMHARAMERMKGINQAKDVLEKHLETGGGQSESTSPESFEPLVEDVVYLGNDPRLDVSSIGFLNRLSAKVALLEAGIALQIGSENKITNRMIYPAIDLIGVVQEGSHFCQSAKVLDLEKYDPVDHQTLEKEIVLQFRDPEGIQELILVRLKFSNDYFAKRFSKRLTTRFCPTNAKTVYKAHQQAKREAYESKQKEEAELMQQAEASKERSNQTSSLDLTPVIIASIAMIILFCIVSGLATQYGNPVEPDVVIDTPDESMTNGYEGKNQWRRVAEASFLGITDVGQKIVYVIDRSFSMEDDNALQAAKSELFASLQKLDSTQQFQIIFYHDDFISLQPREGDYFLGTDAQRLLVSNQIGPIYPKGGTRHLPALYQALSLKPDVVFLLTDGSAESALSTRDFESLRNLNQGRTRIHCIEFGRATSPIRGNANFLVRLSKENGGKYTYLNVSRAD